MENRTNVVETTEEETEEKDSRILLVKTLEEICGGKTSEAYCWAIGVLTEERDRLPITKAYVRLQIEGVISKCIAELGRVEWQYDEENDAEIMPLEETMKIAFDSFKREMLEFQLE